MSGSPVKRSLRPVGYDGVPAGQVKGQLIGAALGGAGDRRENVVALYQFPTQFYALRWLEAEIRRALIDDGTVSFRCVPLYRGDELVPAGLEIQVSEATSGFARYETLLNRPITRFENHIPWPLATGGPRHPSSQRSTRGMEFDQEDVALHTLHRLAPPLSGRGTAVDWAPVEKHLGTPLPEDYKEYIAAYGPGCLSEFIWPFSPSSPTPHLSLLGQRLKITGTLFALREVLGDEECPYALYPEPEGLLPWGMTDNGDILFWQTVGAPDRWPVVVTSARGPDFARFDTSMTGFLAGFLAGQLKVDVFPDDVLDATIPFAPLV